MIPDCWQQPEPLALVRMRRAFANRGNFSPFEPFTVNRNDRVNEPRVEQAEPDEPPHLRRQEVVKNHSVWERISVSAIILRLEPFARVRNEQGQDNSLFSG